MRAKGHTMSAMTPAPAYALLADGSTILIRPAGLADFEAVKAMHEAMSPDNLYRRFFSIGALVAEREAGRVCREAEADCSALLTPSWRRGRGLRQLRVRVAGGTPRSPSPSPTACTTRASRHSLPEHLVFDARDDGIQAFVAETLAENTAMLRVFADAGLPVRKRCDHGVMEVTIPIPRDDTDAALDEYLSAVGTREGSADTASLQPLFEPGSVSASRYRASAWMPRSPPPILGRAWPAWSCSPAAWASPSRISCPGSASASPRSPRWATSSMCPATTC